MNLREAPNGRAVEHQSIFEDRSLKLTGGNSEVLLDSRKVAETYVNVSNFFLFDEVDNLLGLGKHGKPFRSNTFKK